MIVDDEQDILDILEYAFEEWGYSAKTYSDPSKALEELRRNLEKYQIILVDISMYKMDGIELANEILHLNKRTRIVFMSGFDIKGRLRDRLDMLATEIDIIRKPFTLEVLQTILEAPTTTTAPT